MNEAKRYSDDAYIKCRLCPWRRLRWSHGKHQNRALVYHFIDDHCDEGGEELYRRMEAEEDVFDRPSDVW